MEDTCPIAMELTKSSLGAAKLIKVSHCTPEVGCVMTKVSYTG